MTAEPTGPTGPADPAGSAGPDTPSIAANPALADRCLHCRTRKGRTGRNGSRGLCNVCYADVAIRQRYPKTKRPRRAAVAPCAHCGLPRRLRPRRLCAACYAVPEVRALHPARAGYNAGYGYEGQRKRPGVKPPAKPTDALPGTAEKIAVLRARASRGEQLHHPKDARLDRATPAALLELFGGRNNAARRGARPK